ncbi:MAG: DUF1016 N-terminal domain-containing protein [Byssovorax sp.]
MVRPSKKITRKNAPAALVPYERFFAEIVQVIEQARRKAARSVNAVMTATYLLIGRRIVEQEQGGRSRAGYGEALIERLAIDLTARFGRGFSARNIEQMRAFYLGWSIPQTASAKSGASLPSTLGNLIPQTASAESAHDLWLHFPLPWSHYARLLAVTNEHARAFYEVEALRGGWTVRQLDRQIQSQFYERTALSRNKAAMLRKGAALKPEDAVTPEEEIKAPYVLERCPGLKPGAEQDAPAQQKSSSQMWGCPQRSIWMLRSSRSSTRASRTGRPSHFRQPTARPAEQLLVEAIEKTRRTLAARATLRAGLASRQRPRARSTSTT